MKYDLHSYMLMYICFGVTVAVVAVLYLVYKVNKMTGTEALDKLSTITTKLDATLTRIEALPTDEALAQAISDQADKLNTINDALTVIAPLPSVPAGE